MKKYKYGFAIHILGFLYLLVISFVATGCATVPKATEIDYFSLFSTDNDVYLHLNVQKNRNTLEDLLKKMAPDMKESAIKQILDKTTLLYLGLKTSEQNSNSTVEICAVGNFPSIIKASFTKKQGWEKSKRKIENVYGKSTTIPYYNHSSGIEITIPNNAVLFLSTKTTEPLIHSYLNPKELLWPIYAQDLIDKATDTENISAYIPNPSSLLPKILGFGVQLALKDATAVLQEIAIPDQTRQFSTVIQLYFKDARAVKAATALLKLATMGSDMSIVQTGDVQLTITGLNLSIDTLLDMKF